MDTNRINIPSLRFSEFTDEWAEMKLENITTWASGGTPPKDISSYWNGDIPWISASSMRGIEYTNSELKLTADGLRNGSKLAREGSLLLLVRGSMLFKKIPIGIVSRDVAFNQDVKSIVVKDSALVKYILYWFIASEHKILDMVVGTGIGAGKLELQDLKKLKVLLPSLTEQQKIVSFLTAIDAKVALITKKKALLEDYKKGVMQQLFSQKIRFKDDEGNKFPEWEEKKLGDVTDWASGGTPSKEIKSYWNGDIPWISASSMRGIKYSNSELKLTEAGVKNGSRIAPKGTLLLLVRGSMLFKTIPVGIVSRNVSFNQDVKAIAVKNNLLNTYLLNWFLDSENKIKSMVVGTGIGAGKLEFNELKELSISLPSLPEQQKISSFLSAVDRKIHITDAQIVETKNWKKSLLQKVFC